jgi:penicillin-binding protein 2
VALAAWEAGVARPETAFTCSGGIMLGSHEFRCWNRQGHGTVDLHRAMKESCDVWFYRVGMQLGIDRIAATAHRLGLGQPLGFPFGAERGGLIPDRQWKKKRFGTNWYEGETAICSIGQGYVLATPLQLAAMTAAVANGGTVWRPQVLKRVESLQGAVLLTPKPEKLSESRWNPSHLRAVQRSMEAVVNEPGGTAFRSRLAEVAYAGKTGTSQVVGRRGAKEADTSRYEHRDHALFVAYAPAAAPEIAVAVVVEHGGHGGSAAAPVAKAMFEAYFGIGKVPPPVIAVQAGDVAAGAETDAGAEASLPEDAEDMAPIPASLPLPAPPPTIESDDTDSQRKPWLLP